MHRTVKTGGSFDVIFECFGEWVENDPVLNFSSVCQNNADDKFQMKEALSKYPQVFQSQT